MFDILSWLVKDGIKMYMMKWYFEKEQRDIVAIIFDKIILNKFEKEYNQLITYNFDETHKYQNKVFNSSDLMCCIFQYLKYEDKFDGDLLACSLVDSCWLYHTWNANAVYYVDLYQIAKITPNFNKNDNSNISRMWKRLVHAGSVYIHQPPLYSGIVLKKMLLLTNIEVLTAYFKLRVATEIERFKLLMKEYAPRLKICDIGIYESHLTENQLSTIKFPNARKITIQNLFFYPLWSNKCQELVFYSNVNIRPKWCKFVIEHCDCSNVKILKLSCKIDSSVNRSILEQLVAKFTSVEKFKIDISNGVNNNILLFWQLLKPILLKNDGKVELNIDDINRNEINFLNAMIIMHNLKVEMLTANISFNNSNRIAAIKFIESRDNEGLNYLKIGIWEEQKSPKTQLHKLLSFRSINVLEFESKYERSSIGYVNQLLELNEIIKRRMVLIINADVSISEMLDYYHDDVAEKKFLRRFNIFCQKIYKPIKLKLPVDISITFKNWDEIHFKQCMEIYLALFYSKNVLNEYEEPTCNNTSCKPRVKLHTYFDGDRNYKNCELKVMNVEYV